MLGGRGGGRGTIIQSERKHYQAYRERTSNGQGGTQYYLLEKLKRE